MKLIFLYGPPASGKYTIAKLVSEKTGYKLFHNHLTVDLLKSVFEWGTPDFCRQSQKIRLDVFAEAARQNIPGIVHTFVYEKDVDDPFIKSLLDIVQSNGGEVKFIQIYCDRNELMKRVTEESRTEFQKVLTTEHLAKTLDEREWTAPISFVESIKIDSTHLSISETLEKILEAIGPT